MDDHDDCTLVVQTLQKVAHCDLWLTFDPYIHSYSSLCQHKPELISSMQATVIR